MISCESESPIYTVDKDSNSSQTETIQRKEISICIPIEVNARVLAEISSIELDTTLQNINDEIFQSLLIPISKLIRQGTAPQVATNKQLHNRLIKLYYYKLYKSLNEKENNQDYMMFVLSLLAEIVRQHQEVKLPFTRKIVLALLTFDLESFDQSEEGEQLLTILAVLLGNLAKQGKLVIRLKVEHQLNEAILQLLSKTNHIFALQTLLKALQLLQSQTKIITTTEDLKKMGIMKRVYQNWGAKGWYAVRLSVCRPKQNETSIQERKTLLELISQ